MMRTIWKFQVAEQVDMPPASRIIKVDYDGNGDLCIWAIVNPNAEERITRYFDVIGTGIPYDESDWRYIGTVMKDPFVWHVIERIY